MNVNTFTFFLATSTRQIIIQLSRTRVLLRSATRAIPLNYTQLGASVSRALGVLSLSLSCSLALSGAWGDGGGAARCDYSPW